jgi:acylphosphatase
MPQIVAKRWLVSGAVQGVGFRYFVQHKASSANLTGWAKNLSDGRVEVYAVGPSDRLDDLAGSLRIGPPSALVAGVDELPADVSDMHGFEIR